jgi:hypothetical protein
MATADGVNLDAPVTVTPRVSAALARMLSRTYPGTTAAQVETELAKPAAERDIIGMFARGSLEEAIETGQVILLDGGVLGTA